MNHSFLQKLVFVTLFAGIIVALTAPGPVHDSETTATSAVVGTSAESFH